MATIHTLSTATVTGGTRVELRAYDAFTGLARGLVWASAVGTGTTAGLTMAQERTTGDLVFCYLDGTTPTLMRVTPDGTERVHVTIPDTDWATHTMQVTSAATVYLVATETNGSLYSVVGYDAAGAEVGRWLPEPDTADSFLSGISVSGDTLYYSYYNLYTGDGSNRLRRYDLATDSPLSDFYTGPDPITTADPGITFPLRAWTGEGAEDGFAVASWPASWGGPPSYVAGADYLFAQLTSTAVIARPETFALDYVGWVQAWGAYRWLFGEAGSDSGIYFVASGSAPVRLIDTTGTVFTVSEPSTEPTAEPPIRWVRRTPPAVNELKRVFYHRLDLLMDTGTGGPESPAVYLRQSNDGGATWGTPRVARSGVSGHYNKRVYWTPLGSARDKVFEVYGDGGASIVDAYLEFSPGDH